MVAFIEAKVASEPCMFYNTFGALWLKGRSAYKDARALGAVWEGGGGEWCDFSQFSFLAVFLLQRLFRFLAGFASLSYYGFVFQWNPRPGLNHTMKSTTSRPTVNCRLKRDKRRRECPSPSPPP